MEAWASITGMPRNLIDPSLSFLVEDVRRFFDQHIFDQPEAGEAMKRGYGVTGERSRWLAMCCRWFVRRTLSSWK